MRVLLGLRDVILAKAPRREHVGQNVVGELLRKRHRRGDIGIVLGQADEVHLREHWALKTIESGIDERARQLSRPVGPEVEEDNDVAVANPAGVKRARDQKFVGDAFRIRIHHHVARPAVDRRLRANDCLPRLLHAVPTLVAIHRIIAPANRRDADSPPPSFRGDKALELGNIALTARGRHVATIKEAVHADVLKTARDRMLEDREKVLVVRMDASIGEKPHDMQRTAWLLRRIETRVDDLVFVDGTCTARAVDARELLMDDAAGADVQMPDLGVAHPTASPDA